MNYLLDFESKTSGKYFHDGLISISGLISNFYSSKEDFKSLWVPGIHLLFSIFLDMNLNKLWEIVKVTEAWCAVVHGVAELDTTWPPNSNNNILHFFMHFPSSNRGFPGGASGKEPTCQCRRR